MQDAMTGLVEEIQTNLISASKPVGQMADAAHASPPARVPGVTVLIPAYNEEASIADTVRSVQRQTSPAVEIIVIDDCSKDRTGEIARSLGATVVRPAQNQGSKATALNYGDRKSVV